MLKGSEAKSLPSGDTGFPAPFPMTLTMLSPTGGLGLFTSLTVDLRQSTAVLLATVVVVVVVVGEAVCCLLAPSLSITVGKNGLIEL